MNDHASEAAWIEDLLLLAPSERQDFVERARRERPELVDRLSELLASLELSSPRLLPADDAERIRILKLAFAHPNESTLLAGRYELLERLGEGGFGIVWLAEQRSPVRRRVAIKIIISGMDTREVIDRFEAERQALAMMDHPNIAHVFDAGETDDARPFFAMEFVQGVPLTRYCDEQKMPTEARLELFATICHAVQHAHQKGIIHRDLKPSNILVTLHDGQPVPKIIDFGIAKATGTPLSDSQLVTKAHTFLGTPAYSSPEQMDMSGADVDTRSDIYSLGVLLYELMAGRPPFDPELLQKSGLEEMRRIIRDVDPPRVSQCLVGMTSDQQATVAQQRSGDLRKLSLALRRDLDWIAMRCLEKDRSRRYPSASDLASDIRAFLALEPITARPPTTVYRVSKFVRRHQVSVAASALIALALAIGAVVSSSALMRESAARRREQIQHAEALNAAARSEQIARFMKDMMAGVEPSVALGRDTTILREIVDATSLRIDTELANQPQVAAELRSTLASVYTSIGDFSTAEKLLLEAIPVLRSAAPPRPDELATALNRLGAVLKLSSRREAAIPVFEEAVELRQNLYGRRHKATAEALYNLSKVVDTRTGFRELREEVYDIYSEILPPDSPELANALYGLGSVSRSEGDELRGNEVFRQALDIRIKTLNPNHPQIAENLQSIALSEGMLGRTKDAKLNFRKALDIRCQLVGYAHPDVVSTLLRLTSLTPAADEDPEIIRITDKVVSAHRAAPVHAAPGLATALLIRASFTEYKDLLPEQAASMRAEAKSVFSFALRENIPFEHMLLGNLEIATLWKAAAGVPRAGLDYAETFIVICQTLPPTSGFQSKVAAVHFFCGLGHYWSGRFADANESFAQSLALPSAARIDPLRRQLSLSIWAECLLAEGRTAEASALMDTYLPTDQPDVGFIASPALFQAGRCAFLRGELSLAEAAFLMAQKNADTLLQPPHLPAKIPFPPERFDSALGLLRARQGRFAEAEVLCRGALASIETRQQAKPQIPAHIIAEARANLAEAQRLALAAPATEGNRP